jgi:hypothetical protein
MTKPVTNEDRARAVLREIQQIAFGDADQICFEVEDFGTTVLSAIAAALAEAEMREREACAKIADDIELANRENGFSDVADAVIYAAASIRSRTQGNT